MILNPSNWSDPTCHYRFNLPERRSLSDAGILFSIIIFTARYWLSFRKGTACYPENYYCPNPSCQEINLGRFVADIADQNGVIEIQTKGFGQMRKKLSFFLEHYPVQIVYPVVLVKWVVWIDPQTGEITSRRKSPKKQPPMTCFGNCTVFWTFCGRKNFHLPFPFWKVKNTVCWMDTTRTPKKAPLAPRWCPPLF